MAGVIAYRVACGGEMHRVLVDGEHVILCDHDERAELALFGRGGTVCPCLVLSVAGWDLLQRAYWHRSGRQYTYQTADRAIWTMRRGVETLIYEVYDAAVDAGSPGIWGRREKGEITLWEGGL